MNNEQKNYIYEFLKSKFPGFKSDYIFFDSEIHVFSFTKEYDRNINRSDFGSREMVDGDVKNPVDINNTINHFNEVLEYLNITKKIISKLPIDGYSYSIKENVMLFAFSCKDKSYKDFSLKYIKKINDFK